MPRSYLVLTVLPLFDILNSCAFVGGSAALQLPPPQYCHSFCCSQTQKGLATNLMRNRYMLDELTSDVSYSAIGLVWLFKKSVNNNYFIHKTRNTLCCSVDITVTCVNLVFPLGAVIHWSTVQINFILCNCHENQNWKPTVIVTWEAESKQRLGSRIEANLCNIEYRRDR